MRRGLGRGRLLICIGAILALVGTPLPWYTVGGEVLPAVSGNGFDGSGVLVFLAAVGMLAVVALPYASGSGRSRLDTPLVYVALLALGIVGLTLEMVAGLDGGRLGLPDRAPGFWLAGVGMLVAAWGTALLVLARERA